PGASTILLTTEPSSDADQNSKSCPTMEDINLILAKMFGTSEPITSWDDEVESFNTSNNPVTSIKSFESATTDCEYIGGDEESTITVGKMNSSGSREYNPALTEESTNKPTLETIQPDWVIKRMPMYRIPQLSTLMEQEDEKEWGE